MSKYYVTALKNVQLEELEIEADTEAEAIAEYVKSAKRGDVGIYSIDMHLLSDGDCTATESSDL